MRHLEQNQREQVINACHYEDLKET